MGNVAPRQFRRSSLAVLVLAIAWVGFLAVSPPCVTPEAILARLHAPSSYSLHLEQGPEGMRISLADAQGRVVGERTLRLPSACDEQTATISVIVGTWLTELDRAHHAQPQATAPHPVPPPAPPLLPAAAPEGSPQTSLEVGAAATFLFSDGAVAPGLTAQATFGRVDGGPRARLEVSIDGAREDALGPGSVRSQRFAAGLGLSYRVSADPLFAEPYAQVLGALLYVHGQGYPIDAGGVGLDVGAGAGVRLGTSLGSVSPWVALAVTGWAQQSSAQVNGLGPGVALSRVDLSALVGISWTQL